MNRLSALAGDWLVGGLLLALASTAHAQLATALANGDASLTNANELTTEIVAELNGAGTLCRDTLNAIYPTGFTQVDLPGRSSRTLSVSTRNIPLHSSRSTGHFYSWVGEFPAGSRYAVLGSDVFDSDALEVPLAPETLNLIRWLVGHGAPTDVTQLPLVLLTLNTGLRDDIQAWLVTNGLTSNWTFETDLGLLDTGAYDLWVEHSRQDPNGTTTKALASGKPVLSVNQSHHQNDDVLALFDLSWKWSGGAPIGEWASVDQACAEHSSGGAITRLVMNLRDGMPDFDHSTGCAKPATVVECDATAVVDGLGRTQAAEFQIGASYTRDTLELLDVAGVDVFGLGDERRLDKLLVLLGDIYRAAVDYPMDRDATPDTDFYRAWFADHAVHYLRVNNPRPADLGNFAETPGSLDALAGLPPRSRTFTPTIHNEWTAAGLYAPPGRTFTVRRLDGSANEVKLRLNLLHNTIRLWDPDGYKAPKFISSPSIELQTGRDYVLSTPYGGPIYIWWKAVATSPDDFEIEFENVLEHPFLDGVAPADIAAFAAEIATTPFEWTDIRTPFAEIHQPTRFARDVIATQYGGDGERYVRELNDYLIINNYWLAGLVGPGIPPLPAQVQAFCAANALDCTDPVIHRAPRIQHINGYNPARCGWACAGNPFDKGGPIDPLNYTESHEMGHNLQRWRLNIYDDRSTEVSTNIFPSFTRSKYAADVGVDFVATRDRNPRAYPFLQSTIERGEAPGIGHSLWAEDVAGSEPARREFYHHIAYLNHSWHVFTQLYLVERLFTDAIEDDAKWAAEKDKLFFSTYTRAQADAITAEDFMYVVLSCMARRDHLEFFEIWGVAVSDLAKTQVATCNPTEMVPVVFYHTDEAIYAELPDFPSNIIPLDGVSLYRDPDIDNDHVRNENDDLPFDPTETLDTDGDGIGNNADTDDDDDGMPDAFETTHGFDPLDAADGPLDSDRDGFSNAEEAQAGTLPQAAGSRPATTVDAWIDAPSLATPRTSHAAALLAGGEVLVSGGLDASYAPTASSELFDVATSTWGATGALVTARLGHTSTRLADGRVLAVGGQGPSFTPLASSELYDPGAGTWTPVADALGDAREKHTATVLADGRVLIVGGVGPGGTLASAELYDPVAGTWFAAASLGTARSGHSATLLGDGRVLVAGGRDFNDALDTAELYDPATDTWSPAAAMDAVHHEHSATLLADGRVLVAGGLDAGVASAAAEIYDPALDQWQPLGALGEARGNHVAALLPDGSVLLAAGSDGLAELDSGERLPAGGLAWQPTAQTVSPARSEHTATVLADGRVLVVGGFNDFDVLDSAMLYAW